MTSRTCMRTSTSLKRSWPRSDPGPIRSVVLGALVAVAMLNSVPSKALACREVTYRVTVIGPTGKEASAMRCSVGAIAAWLDLYPQTTISPSVPPGDLGSLYVVRFEDVSMSQTRLMLQLRLYPEASEGPIVDLLESGFIQTESYTGSVTAGWRRLDPTTPVPSSLMALGVPPGEVSARSLGREPSPTDSGSREPDAVSLSFLVAIVVATALIAARRARRQTSA